jgi:hypothetical protein
MKRAEPGWLVLALAGIAALIGSFLPFYTYASGVDVTVWSRGLFPTATLIPILGFLLAVEAVFVLLMGYEPRSPFFNFTWEQVRIGTGAFMILLSLCYVVQDRAGGGLGSGYVILSLAALMTFTGGVMTRRAQIVRAPADRPPARAPSLKPVLATLKRWGGGLTDNAAALGRNAKEHLGLGDTSASTKDAEEPGRVTTLSPVQSESKPAAQPQPAGTSPDGDAKAAPSKPAKATPKKATPRKARPKKAAAAKPKPKAGTDAGVVTDPGAVAEPTVGTDAGAGADTKPEATTPKTDVDAGADTDPGTATEPEPKAAAEPEAGGDAGDPGAAAEPKPKATVEPEPESGANAGAGDEADAERDEEREPPG